MKTILISTGILLLLSTVALAQSENSYIRNGNILYKENKFKDAEIDYRKSIEHSKNPVKGQYNLGNSLYKQNTYDEAAKSYMNAFQQMKNATAEQKAAALHNLGNSMLKSEKYAESIDAYKQALRLNPKDEDTRYNLSYAMQKMQQQQQQQQKNDKNKDKNDKNKEDQQNNQQNNDQQQQDDQQEQKQPRQQISKQDAERMLQALNNDEQRTIDKLKKQKAKPVQVQVEKDW